MPIDSSLIGREYYVFRDSTHNLIFIEDPRLGVLLRSLLDTFEFQRLRRVRQNGLGYMVYPSLEGTRFPHSLGSFAIAKRVIEALQEQQPGAEFGFPEALRIDTEAAHGFAIAAALHDIGHAPLSHTWEIIDEGIRVIDSSHHCHNHEAVGVDVVLSEHSEIGRVIRKLLQSPGTYEHKVISAALEFLQKTHPLVYLRPLLSGNLDIDRLDFIARDTRNAGVTYGSHDLDWLVRAMRFGRLPRTSLPSSSGPWVIAIDARKGLNALIQYLRARENMYGLVYLHKTVRAANHHLTAILVLAAHLLRKGSIKSEKIPLLEYLKRGTSKHPLGVLSLDDTDVWFSLKGLCGGKDPALARLSQEFLSRRFYKSRQVSEHTAHAIESMLRAGGFAGRIRPRLAKYPTLRDRNVCPDALLCQLVAKVDKVAFDVVGKEKSLEDETWIMYRRPTDLGLLPLKQYWRERVDSETSKTFCFVHFLDEIATDMLEVIGRLEGAFPQLRSMIEPAVPVISQLPPTGFEIQKVLSDGGHHKQAYLAVYTGQDGDRGLSCGEPYVIKRYRDLSEEATSALVDCIADIYRTTSDHISRPLAIREDSAPLWLVERFWVSDLLKLVLDTGIRQDVHFLAQMAHDLFSGLAELAKKNIRHGDLKLENCGVVDAGAGEIRFLIGDFGAASAVPDAVPRSEEELGSLKSRPPELLSSERRVGLGSDVWSLAATVFAAATGKYPFMPWEYPSARKRELADQVQADLPNAQARLESEIKTELPGVLGDILGPCLLSPLELRPSADHVRLKFAGLLSTCHDFAQKSPTENKVLYWQRSLDLLDIGKYVSSDSFSGEANARECSQLAERGTTWIPPSVLQRLGQYASSGQT